MTGLVLFDRHLYLVLAVVVAACVFLLVATVRCQPRWPSLVGAPFVTIVLFETPQLTANTLGALLLTRRRGARGGDRPGRQPRRYALASGVAFGLACVAYPTVVLMAPFVAILLAFSVGAASRR